MSSETKTKVTERSLLVKLKLIDGVPLSMCEFLKNMIIWFKKITSIYIHIRHYPDKYDEKKPIIEKMHLTQFGAARMVHQISTSNYQENLFQCKFFNQKQA